MTRGIIYIVWGNYRKDLLKRSTDSAERFGYDYTVKVIEPKYEGLINKIEMFDSPYDTTLFLDADTEIKSDISYGFEMAEKHGIACCIAPACTASIMSESKGMEFHPDMPQLNTGVVFFNNGTHGVDYIQDEWKELMLQHPLSAKNDQPAFSQAVYENLNPFILPKTWNYRSKVRYEGLPHGEIKINHSR